MHCIVLHHMLHSTKSGKPHSGANERLMGGANETSLQSFRSPTSQSPVKVYAVEQVQLALRQHLAPIGMTCDSSRQSSNA
jgi:hypothetical protein